MKKILLESKSTEVAEKLAGDFQKIWYGTAHYEMLNWKDVKIHAIRILNQTGNYVFFTQDEIDIQPNLTDLAKTSGKMVVIVDESVGESLHGLKDFSGNLISNMAQFESDYLDSFEFEFIEPGALNPVEKAVYSFTPDIIKLFGGLPKIVKEIKIAAKLHDSFNWHGETLGVWEESTQSVIIHRKTLQSLQDYSGTLVHELIHAKTGYDDVTRAFELSLTEAIGTMCVAALRDQNLTAKQNT